MKINEVISEAPLQDYEYIPTKYSKKSFKQSYIDEITSTPYVEELRKRLQKIGSDIHAYIVPYKELPMNLKKASKSVGYFYYVETDRRELVKLLGKKIAAQIKTGPKDVTVILRGRFSDQPEFDEDSPSTGTVWGFLHDFVHALTLTSTEQWVRITSDVDKILSKIDPRRKLVRIKDDYSKFLTMKSAREGYLRGGERGTETMVQWIYTGRVKLDPTKLLAEHPDIDPAYKQEVLRNAKEAEQQLGKMYQSFITEAEGKIFFMSS